MRVGEDCPNHERTLLLSAKGSLPPGVCQRCEPCQELACLASCPACMVGGAAGHGPTSILIANMPQCLRVLSTRYANMMCRAAREEVATVVQRDARRAMAFLIEVLFQLV